MHITAEITGIKYKVLLSKKLPEIEFQNFDINAISTACLINESKGSFAISKWVSPKRTRSYPYERVYNTLNISKKITVIPVVKDEGAKGDRDFIQWDTVSLMSLLDVYVIFAYYDKAVKHKSRPNKITRQQFDNQYVVEKIREIGSYHSSALHWNLKELNTDFYRLIEKVKESYQAISAKTLVNFHSLKGLDDFRENLFKDVNFFMEASRMKAQKAQMREWKTVQPKEVLRPESKATLTIQNYLGGFYFLTVDEAWLENDTLYLAECKHSKLGLLPSRSDVKDGLLKMILLCNLMNVSVSGNSVRHQPVLSLSSSKLKRRLNSTDSPEFYASFFAENRFSNSQKQWVEKLFEEASLNGFLVVLQNATL